MLLTTHLAPDVMIGPTIASGVILNPKILREYIALTRKRHLPPNYLLTEHLHKLLGNT